jgi:aryl-alcohol dehydrogenase-like predicted oxidoreductase
MEERNVGDSPLRASVVGLGGNNFGGRLDAAATRGVVHAALDAGVTFFDCADTYGKRGGGQTGAAEIALGQALGPRRKDIVLSTKFGHAMDDEGKLKGASRRYIMSAIDASLKRLGTDWIDLYQLHADDPSTPLEETMRALNDLVRAGKVRHIGCSNISPVRFVEANRVARSLGLAKFVSLQQEYSLVNRSLEREAVPAAKAHGLGILPFYPLASGLLTGKYKPGAPPPPGSRFANPSRFETRFQNEETEKKVVALTAFAESRGHTLLELAMSWLAARPFVSSIIAGATAPQQVAANVRAASWRLTPDDLAEVDRLTSA